jgi:hypothetical integral membrane protein (TIGR02206 family)
MFGTQHLLSLLFFILFGIALIRWARRQHEELRFRIAHYFAWSIAATVVFWTTIKIYIRGFDVEEDLPLHLCNFMALLLPVFTATRKYVYYEILLFWILAGTTHAVITPDLQNGFPNYVYIKYWYVHAGLIIFILYATLALGFRPTLKSAFRSFIALQGYIVLMFGLNALFGSNYFYTYGKPDIPSALDYLGSYPYYILTVELIMIPYFLLIYLPFHLTRKREVVTQTS